MVNEFLEWQCFREISSNEVCTTCVHNPSDRALACCRKESPAMRGFSFFTCTWGRAPAALNFLQRNLQTGNSLPYGAIDCIAVNRCV